MKNKSFLNKLILLPVICTIGSIPTMSLTSCSSDNIYVSYTDYNSILENKNYYGHAVFQNIEYWKILYGSKNFYNGNYIVIFGSSTFSDTNKFFTGQESSFTSLDKWYKKESDGGYFDKSIFYSGLVSNTKNIKNFGIFNVIDYFDGKIFDNKNHEINVFLKNNKSGIKDDKISPWTKWDKNTINNTASYNKKDYDDKSVDFLWDKDSVSESDYIRNDQSAKAFRAMATFGAKLYPKSEDDKNPTTGRSMTFNTADNNSDSCILVFVDGKLKTINYLFTTPSSWSNLISSNFEDVKEEKKDNKNTEDTKEKKDNN